MQIFRLADVVVDPLADLARAVALETHPDFQAPEAARLLEPVDVILVALIGLVEFVGKIRGLDPKGCGESALIFDQYGTRIEGSIEPLVWIDGDGIGEFQTAIAHRRLAGQ